MFHLELKTDHKPQRELQFMSLSQEEISSLSCSPSDGPSDEYQRHSEHTVSTVITLFSDEDITLLV